MDRAKELSILKTLLQYDEAGTTALADAPAAPAFAAAAAPAAPAAAAAAAQLDSTVSSRAGRARMQAKQVTRSLVDHYGPRVRDLNL